MGRDEGRSQGVGGMREDHRGMGEMKGGLQEEGITL